MPDLQSMNKAQREAVTRGEGPLLLLAGPGSGKTFTIVNRILFLIEQGIPPEKILVVTFTKEAAISMQCRFRRISDQFYPVNFGTFHSVFYHILKESGGFRHKSLILDSQKKKLLIPILKHINEKTGDNTAQEEEDVLTILSAISFYKNTGNLEKATEKLSLPVKTNFTEIWKAYCAAMSEEALADFDDMLFECRKLLKEDRREAEYWRKRFSHILIDEFQDINPVQYEVLKLLSEKPNNIFAVGDDDQSIYGFRGSNPELMRRFEEEFCAEKLLLNINYRCGKEILDASSAVIRENRNRFVKEFKSAPGKEINSGNGKVILRSFPDKTAEIEFVSERLKLWLKEYKEDDELCAVLFRTNADMQRIAAELKRVGVPYLMKEKVQSIYEHFIVKDIMAYLLLAAGEWRREYLIRIINRPSRYISREAIGEGRSLKDMREYYERNGGKEVYRDIIMRIEQLERQLNCLKRMSVNTAINYILKAVGYENFLKIQTAGNKEKQEEWNEIIDWLKTDASKYRSAAEWKKMQEAFNDSQKTEKRKNTKEAKEKIRLMTIHGAKGLEFHTVIVPDCNEKNFPHGNMPDSSCVEEERRLLYVAMTRAKENLEILYLTGDELHPRLPSRFLNPLLNQTKADTN